jgi:hypothetical protein
MNPMGWLAWMIIGGVAGWLASMVILTRLGLVVTLSSESSVPSSVGASSDGSRHRAL